MLIDLPESLRTLVSMCQLQVCRKGEQREKREQREKGEEMGGQDK